MGFNNHVSELECKYTPKVLMGVKISHSALWSILLQHGEDRDIFIFRKRLDQYQLPLEVFCDNIDLFCEKLPPFPGHYFSQVEKEDDWQAIFKFLAITNIDHQNSLKVIANKFTTEEISMYTR